MRDREDQRLSSDSGDDGEVEILEIVGLDGEATPPGLDLPPPSRPDARPAAGPPRPEPPAGGGGGGESAGLEAGDDRLLRLRADYDNLRKRIDRERQEYELHANLALIGRLLPILDSFERALAIEAAGAGDVAFREGCAMIYKQLTDELRRQGLRAIHPVGASFDPEMHDAVATDATAAAPANTVVEELRRGYLFRSRLLRPAMVKVSTNGGQVPESE